MKKFYKKLSNAYVGGVCSGLGEFFNVNPVLFRLVFIVSSIISLYNFKFLLIPLVYLLIWMFTKESK